MGISSGFSTFKLQFGVSPIVMTGGAASQVPGGAISVTSILQSLEFVGGLLSLGDSGISLEDFFAYFQPLPGGTLIDNQIGMYPFANQSVAANAIIKQPLTISMLMVCPARGHGGYSEKLAVMSSIQATFDNHNSSGGLYTILTPAFVYADCVMTAMTDISSGATKQVQNAYKLDFLKPLVTLAQAAQAQNSLMSKITAGLQTDGAQTGLDQVTGSTIGATSPTFIPTSIGQGSVGIFGSSNPFSTP